MKINAPGTITTAPSRIPPEITHLRGYFPATPEGQAAFLDFINLWVQFAPASPHDREFIGCLTRILCLESLVQHNIKIEMAALLKEIHAGRMAAAVDRKDDKETFLVGTAELKSAAIEGFKAAAEIRSATKELCAATKEKNSIKPTHIVIVAVAFLALNYFAISHLVYSAVRDVMAQTVGDVLPDTRAHSDSPKSF